MNLHTVTSNNSDRNDIVTICELLCDSHRSCVNPHNAISGFKKTVIWSEDSQGVNMSFIRETDFTSGHISSKSTETLPLTRSVTAMVQSGQFGCDSGSVCIHNAKQFYDLFVRQSERLLSDGAVVENGTIKVVTTQGASLTDNVINALPDRDLLQEAQREQRAVAQAQREERAAQLEIALTQAQQKREQARRRQANLKKQTFKNCDLIVSPATIV